MGIARQKKLARLEAQVAGDPIPIFCVEESEVATTIDRMIAAGELTEADRVLCVYWLKCTGPNAPSDADLRSLLAQCKAGAPPLEPEVAHAPKSDNAD